MSGTWRVSVDEDVCVGHGQCFARAPEVYQPDEDGFCLVSAAEVDDASTAAARAGADACPERAIAVTASTI